VGTAEAGVEGTDMSQQELDFSDEASNYAECPEPGMYPDVAFEDYVAWRAVNSGVVKWGPVSPKHMHAAFEGRLKSEDTRSKKLGRAIHAMVLEPDTFHQRHIVSGRCCGVIKSGDREGQTCGSPGLIFDGTGWFCGTHGRGRVDATGGKTVISDNEWKRCEGVKAALKDHIANKVLARKGFCEQSIVWEYRGLRMKCRLDKAADGTRPVILDLKKCRVGFGTTEECQRAVYNYDYHVSAAMYVKAVEFHTGKQPEFIWVFVEDDEPFDIQVIPASQEDLAIGWHIAKSAIDRYAQCVKRGEIPGYIAIPENIHPGGLPPWVVKEALKMGWLDESDDGTGEGDGRGADDSQADEQGLGTGGEAAGVDHPSTTVPY
jgi:hypothetical protein